MRKKRKSRARAAKAQELAADHKQPEVAEAIEGTQLAVEAEKAERAAEKESRAEAETETEAEVQAEAETEAGDEAGAADEDDSASEGVVLEGAGLKRVVESVLFAAEKPMTAAAVRQLLGVRSVGKPELQAALDELVEDYNERGIVLHCVAGGYQFRTHPSSSAVVQRMVAGRPVRLSRAQLDTLAIIAYRQPITRPEIDEIRGVDSGGTLRVLLERNLIRVLGKKEEPGRPLLYGSTKEFLAFFNLSDLRDLPTLREFHELTEESVREAERRGVDLGDDGGSAELEAMAAEAKAKAAAAAEAELAAAEADVAAAEADATEAETAAGEASEAETAEAEMAETDLAATEVDAEKGESDTGGETVADEADADGDEKSGSSAA